MGSSSGVSAARSAVIASVACVPSFMVWCPEQSTRKHASWWSKNRMQIFVTGATGVPGKAVGKRLIAGDHVDMTNRKPYNIMAIVQRLFAKVRGTRLDFHRGRTSMKSYTGYTSNGVEVSCKIDPEKAEAIVEYEEYLRFFFNADFPQDAKAFFDALCKVRGIAIDVGEFHTIPHTFAHTNTTQRT